jgi:hypothetical protein
VQKVVDARQMAHDINEVYRYGMFFLCKKHDSLLREIKSIVLSLCPSPLWFSQLSQLVNAKNIESY